MFFRQALGQRQPKPRTLNAARERIVRPIKGLEDFRFFPRGDAGTTIEHTHVNGILSQVSVDLDLFLAGAVFFCVRQEVHENLGEGVLIAADGVRRRRGLPLGGESLLAEMQLLPFPGPGQDGVHIERAKIVALLLSFEPGEIEHVVDQPGEPLGFGDDDPQVLGAFFRGRVPALHHFGKHADRRQRGLELMRDIGNEIGFLLGERKLAARIREDGPAAKGDRRQGSRDQKQERAANPARIFLQLFRTIQIEPGFPVRQRFANFGSDKWPAPIAARLVRWLGGNRLGLVVQERDDVIGRGVVRQGIAPEIVQGVCADDTSKNHSGRFGRAQPKENLEPVLHETRDDAFRPIGGQGPEVCRRRDELRHRGHILFQDLLRGDIPHLGLLVFILHGRRWRAGRRNGRLSGVHRRLLRPRKLVGFHLRFAPLFQSIRFLGNGINRAGYPSGKERAIIKEELLAFGVTARFLRGRRDEISVRAQGKSDRRTRPGGRQLRGEITGELWSRCRREQLAHALGKRASLFVDQASRRGRDGIGLLLIKLGGPAFQDDLLLVRAPQGQPAEPDARQDDGEEKYPDASFHEAEKRRLSCSGPLNSRLAAAAHAADPPREGRRGRSTRLPSNFSLARSAGRGAHAS